MARHYFRKAFSARLSRHLTLWAFSSLMAIEAIILLPSYFKRERDLLATQESLVLTSLETAFVSAETDRSPAEAQAGVMTALRQLKSQAVILDYAVTTAQGTSLTHQSRVLNIDLQTTQALLERPSLRRMQQRYDSAIYLEQTQPPLYIFVRHDTQAIQSELNAYTGRMLGMILLISLVVTVATMVGVERLVIRPVLYLQADLLTAINNVQVGIQESSFQSIRLKHKDELGEVIDTFGLLYEKVWQAMTAREAAIQAEQQERERANQLHHNISHLHQTQTQLVQSEKMSSLSQLVAGIAHEINNPITFIHGNLKHLSIYMEDLLSLVQLYEHYYPEPVNEIAAETKAVDLDFIQGDLPKLLSSIEVGSNRVRDIVLSLRNFSRLDEAEVKPVDIHEGLENTLVLLNHRLASGATESRIRIVRDYVQLPMVECYAGLLNQAFMSVLINAIEAFDKAVTDVDLRRITLRTALIDDEWVQIAIANNGPPISPKVQKRMFEPFFTTKAVGQGTGMGLPTAYQIVTIKHKGKLVCFSEENTETEFVIQIPISHQ